MKILHPTDFFECATQAEAMATRSSLGAGGGTALQRGVISRRQVQTVYDAQRKWSEDALEPRAGKLREFRWAPHEEIVRTAEEEHAEMIVMGTHGRSGLNRALLGSVTERVIRLARCPVLTVRQAKPGGGQ